ncbi:MAG: aldehyde dehydrogenase family protein, partial [Maritimibacter sp.]|nr:aldehyde dehydrogenase family protein [Maritimibacter sp.]
MPKDLTHLRDMLADPSLLETRAFVAGKWVEAASGATFPVTNPARGDVIAEVADLSRREVADAIDAAHAGQKDWAKWTGKERAAVLRK